MRILFIGSLTQPGEEGRVPECDVLSWAVAQALKAQGDVRLEIISTPDTSAKPGKGLWTSMCVWYIDHVRVRQAASIDLPLARACMRFIGVLRGTGEWWHRAGGKDSCVLVYGMRPHRLWAAALTRLFHRDMTLLLIVPQLPRQYAPRKKALTGALCTLQRWLTRFPLRFFDGFVPCSDSADSAVNRARKPKCIMNGLYREYEKFAPYLDTPVRTLALVCDADTVDCSLDMCDLFMRTGAATLRLIVYAPPRAEKRIRARIAADARVSLCTDLDGARLRAALAGAALILLPRLPGSADVSGAIQRITDCMASGRPVMTPCAPHLPRDYASRLMLIRAGETDAMAEALEQAALMHADILSDIGQKGLAFVRDEKNARRQCERLRELIDTYR